MKKLRIPALAAVVFFFLSCDNFYRGSFGSFRNYDSSNINVSAANVDEWIDHAVGNPQLAAAVVEKIIEEMEKLPPNSPEKAKLLEGGIILAVESSRLGEIIITRAAELLGDLDDDHDSKTVENILHNIQMDFDASGGKRAADSIAHMINMCLRGSPALNGGIPRFEEVYARSARPGDAAEAILVLVLGELNGNSVDDWNDIQSVADGLTIANNRIQVDTGRGNPSPSSLALAAYLNLIADDPDKFGDNPLTETIYDAFFG